MKVSLRWLHEFLPSKPGQDDLLRLLPELGFDVDAVEPLGPSFTGVVTAKVLEASRHPNADRLSLCKVSDGSSVLEVVCGAPNVAAGQVVAFAAPGARLPGGREIGRARIRGAESAGMLCSSPELGLPGSDSGILVLPGDTPLGLDAASLLGERDCVLEVDVTPNRPDCLCVYGLARELAVHAGLPLIPLEPPEPEPEAGLKTRPVEILEPGSCRRYLGREFSGLKVGPSPGWLCARLEAVGQKPINALVDITNLVLFETGHPLHAFDSAKLRGSVRVRRAKAGERLKALDAKTYELAPEDLVVADDGGPAAIAGIMGGEPAAVTAKTTACFLEAAHFTPSAVHKTSRRLALRSESSYRFERGTSPETAALASRRAGELILRLCGGKAAPLVDEYPGKIETSPIRVTASSINGILGTTLAEEELEKRLAPLARTLERREGGWLFHPPSWRLDLAIVQDVAEEVARHIGYDSIPGESGPVRLPRPSAHPLVEAARGARASLSGMGFSEAANTDFLSDSELAWCEDPRESAMAVANPISADQAFLRSGLAPGLLRAASYNASRGRPDLRLFEVGRRYAWDRKGGVRERTAAAALLCGRTPAGLHWREKSRELDFHDASGVLDALLELWPGARTSRTPAGLPAYLHPKAAVSVLLEGKPIGFCGLLHPRKLGFWDLPGPAALLSLDLDPLCAAPLPPKALRPFSPFPSVVRDISLLFGSAAEYAAIAAAVKEAGGEALSKVELADLFTGKGVPEGKKSMTLRLTFSLMERTLTDAEVNSAARGIIEALGAKFTAILRG